MGALSSYSFTPGEFAVASVNLALPPSGTGRCRPHSTLKLPVTGRLGVHGQRPVRTVGLGLRLTPSLL